MKLLIVDMTTEAQAFCAKRIEAFNQSDSESSLFWIKIVKLRFMMLTC